MSEKRKKPKFLRQDWHKKIKIGSKVKRKRKWRAAKGRHSKIRLGRAGHTSKPKIGWGADRKIKGKINNMEIVRVENLMQLEKVEKGEGVIVGKVGRKKRQEILEKAKARGLKIINKYRKEVNATK